MRTRSRALGRPLVICMLVGALALGVAACGGSSKKSSTSGGGGGSKTSATAPTAGGKTVDGTVIYGTLPAVGTPKPGGTITQSQITGATPTFIFPLVSGSLSSTDTFDLNASMFIPLYNGPSGATPSVNLALSAAAAAPTASNGDKTFTIPLKTGLKWANGAPVNAQDVLFYIDLLKAAIKESPANWGQYVPGEFPASVTSMSAPNSHTVVLHLNKGYNPGYFLNNQLQDTNGGVYPMPATAWNIDKTGGPHLNNWSNPAVAKKIYDYLSKQGGSVATFATNPLWKDNDGPFKLKSFSATNSSYNEVPNPTYGLSPKPQYADLSVQTYTSNTAALNAFRSGSLDIITAPAFDPSELGQVGALKSVGTVYGGPGWGWFGGIINFKDKTNDFDKVISQLYVRQAIAHLINQPGIIKGVYKNAAATSYGQVPSAPASQYTPADALTAPYPYSPSTAVSILKAHGWKVVPNGQTTCQKAGTGAGECGAGIPVGTPIKFVWANTPLSFSTTATLESEALASIAKQAAGINIQLQTKTFNFLTANYTNVNPANAKYTNDWGVNNYGGLFTDYYPTAEGTWNPGAGFNDGSFNDPTANKLMSASVFSANLSAVKTEASYITKNFPVFFFPNQDNLSAVSKKVGGPANSWLVLTQQETEPQFWYLTK